VACFLNDAGSSQSNHKTTKSSQDILTMTSSSSKQPKNFRLLVIPLITTLLGGLWLYKRRQSLRQTLSQRLPRITPGRALITGASSGLGASFARKLAALGFDLVLVSRRSHRLEVLAEELQHHHGVRCEVFPADLSDLADVERVAAHIQSGPPLVLLINNAGFGMGGRFARGALKRQLEMVNVHVIAPTCLVQAALPGMLASKRGIIINVSSVASFLPLPGSVMYATTKRALNALSESLNMELHSTGIHVQALCPGFFTSEFHNDLDPQDHPRRWAPAFMWTDADYVADYSLNQLGNGRVIAIPTLVYQAIVFFATNPLTLPIVKIVIRQLM
jgi:uncharacterized protein